MLLVHMGSPSQGESFLRTRWPEARAVSDPDKVLFRGFGLGRASLGQVFGLRVWREALKVARFGVGRPVGDTLAMGGTFVVSATGTVVASDVADHAGDLPDYVALAATARRLGGAALDAAGGSGAR